MKTFNPFKRLREAFGDTAAAITGVALGVQSNLKEDLKGVKQLLASVLIEVKSLKSELKEANGALHRKEADYNALLKNYFALAMQTQQQQPATKQQTLVNNANLRSLFDEVPLGDEAGYSKEELLLSGYEEGKHESQKDS